MMPDCIEKSNLTILEIIEARPNTPIVKELKKWKLNNNLRDYHTTLEFLTSKLGIGMGMFPLFKNKKIIGWIPYINYYGYNTINENPRKEELVEIDNFYFNIEKCQYKLTKETIYKLMEIRDIENLLI